MSVTHVPAHLLHVKLENLAYTLIVACSFGMHLIVSEHVRYTNDVRHELALSLLHYMCDVQIQWTHIDNEMHRFYS